MAVSDETRVDAVRPHHRERTQGDIRLVLTITAILDVMMIVVAVILAWDLRVAFDVFSSSAKGAGDLIAGSTPWVIGLWFLLIALQGGYSSRYFGAGSDEWRTVTTASVATAGVIAMGCYLLQIPLSRGFLLLSFLLGIPLLLFERWTVRKIVHRMRRRGRLVHRVIAVGGPSGVAEVYESLRRASYVGYQIVGVCVPDSLQLELERFPVPVLGRVQETRQLCHEHGADTVLVARGGYDTSQDLRRIGWALEGSSIELVVVPSLTDIAGPRIHMRPVAGLPLLHLEQPQAGEAGGWSKRAFDVLGSLTALVLLAPVMALVAILIRLEDRGPVLFKQPRVGRDGTQFACLKFRSMYVDADRHEAELRAADGHDGALWKRKEDPRVTRTGSFLRRYSVDELPQLLNVLRGDMSLVGPRPQQAWEVETYSDWEGRRLRVRPGMTGLWQVSGRSQLTFDEAIRLDLYYVDNWSLASDLVIIFKTVRAVFGSDGAY